jgi:hypothetical protein
VRQLLEKQQKAFEKYRDDATALAAALDGGTASDQYPAARRAGFMRTIQRIELLESVSH